VFKTYLQDLNCKISEGLLASREYYFIIGKKTDTRIYKQRFQRHGRSLCVSIFKKWKQVQDNVLF